MDLFNYQKRQLNLKIWIIKTINYMTELKSRFVLFLNLTCS